MKKVKILLTAITVSLFLVVLSACGGGQTEEGSNVLRVGVVGAFNIHWETIAEMVAEDGIYLEIVTFSDFMTPNRALAEGDLDINAFQHKMFLASDSAANGYNIQYIAETFYVPMHIFNNVNRISSIDEIADGHTIAIPSDPTNNARALRFLEYAGFITINENIPAGTLPSILDVEYIVNINIIEAEAGMLANMIPDVEAAVIGSINAFSAGLNPTYDSIFAEHIYGENVDLLTNVIVVRDEDVYAGGERMEMFNAIVRAHHTDVIRQIILDEYQGALRPVW